MGMGKVRMNTPERAQKPPMILPISKKYFSNILQIKEIFEVEGRMKILPSKVLGFMSYPTVVIVIKPHLRNRFLLIEIKHSII